MKYVLYKRSLTYHFPALKDDKRTACGLPIGGNLDLWEVVDLEKAPPTVQICRSCQHHAKRDMKKEHRDG